MCQWLCPHGYVDARTLVALAFYDISWWFRLALVGDKFLSYCVVVLPLETKAKPLRCGWNELLESKVLPPRYWPRDALYRCRQYESNAVSSVPRQTLSPFIIDSCIYNLFVVI